MDTEPMDADRAAVRQVNEELYRAFEGADLDRMQELWADDGLAGSVMCVHPGWPALRGRTEVLRSWAVIMANTTYIQFVLTDVEIDLAGDVAIVTCVENILTAAEDADGEDPAAGGTEAPFAGAKGVATNVLRRTATGWRVWMRHGSPVLTPAEPDGEQGETGG